MPHLVRAAAVTAAVVTAVLAPASAFAATASNTAPSGADDTFGTLVNHTVVLDPLANDTDPDGDALTVTNVTAPTYGTVSVNADGRTLTYTPPTGFNGDDTFTYTPNDGTTDGNVTTVDVIVSLPAAPTAVNDNAVVTVGDTTLIDVLHNDDLPDANGVTVTVVKQPTKGYVEVQGTEISYAADVVTSTDSFGYQVCDEFNQCSQATVSVVTRDVPRIATAAKTCAKPHLADAQITFNVTNPADGGGDDADLVAMHGVTKMVRIADGASAQVTFVNLPASDYTVRVWQEDSTIRVSKALTIHTCATIDFRASVAQYAMTSGTYKGKAKATLNNYWSGRAITAVVKDGYGKLHKWSLNAEQAAKTVYVPTPRGAHYVSVYRLTASGAKVLVVKRLVHR